MKRLHVSINVFDIESSAAYYTALFGAPPTVRKDDYAKWMLDDPRVNFSITAACGCGEGKGVSHLGIQAETPEELSELEGRLSSAELSVRSEKEARCCYAVSDKHWGEDPSGVAWELFHTKGQIDTFGEGAQR